MSDKTKKPSGSASGFVDVDPRVALGFLPTENVVPLYTYGRDPKSPKPKCKACLRAADFIVTSTPSENLFLFVDVGYQKKMPLLIGRSRTVKNLKELIRRMTCIPLRCQILDIGLVDDDGKISESRLQDGDLLKVTVAESELDIEEQYLLYESYMKKKQSCCCYISPMLQTMGQTWVWTEEDEKAGKGMFSDISATPSGISESPTNSDSSGRMSLSSSVSSRSPIASPSNVSSPSSIHGVDAQGNKVDGFQSIYHTPSLLHTVVLTSSEPSSASASPAVLMLPAVSSEVAPAVSSEAPPAVSSEVAQPAGDDVD